MQLFAQNKDYQTITNIHYYNESINKSDVYINERCVLDVYIPKNVKNFSTVIWFHGGGLTGGNKEIPKYLQEKGIAVIGVNYRLSPQVNAAKAIEDAAAATAWVLGEVSANRMRPALPAWPSRKPGGFRNGRSIAHSAP